MKILLLFFIFSFSFKSYGNVTISGKLLERGTKNPLTNVNVFILPHKIKAVTDDQGEFVVNNIPEGEFQWVINATNYKRMEKKDSTDNNQKRNLYLEKESYLGFETVVIGQYKSKDVSRKSLQAKDFLNLPGSNGDPVKAVQNLPGVNRVAGFSSNVVIQGSAPKDTTYAIDGHEIPLVFHFGGLTSVLTPEAVSEVEYLSAGYGPEYSKALGGIINLSTREADVGLRNEKGFFFADNLKMGGLYELKLSEKSNMIVTGRYSYIGLFLKQVLKNREDFNLTVAPEFADFSIIYNNKISESDDFKTVFIASKDTLGFLFTEPLRDDPGVRGNFKNETTFYRIIPQWRRQIDSSREVSLSTGIGQDKLLVDIGDNYFKLNSSVLTTRGEWSQQLSSKFKTQFGFDNAYSRALVNLKLPVFSNAGGVSNPVASSTIKELSVSAKINNLGLYSRNEWKPMAYWTIIPSLRWDRFSQTRETHWAPRLAIQKDLSDSATLSLSSGLYFQPPEPAETAPDFGNPDLKSPRALHQFLSYEKDWRQGQSNGWKTTFSYFRRDFDDLVVSSTNLIERNGSIVAEAYNNEGSGYAQGIESQIKWNFNFFSGWISYTLSESRRNEPGKANYLYEYDQTHNFNIVSSYETANNWKFSGRYRYVTGNPFTPVIDSRFDADNDVYIPIRGPFYSSRQSAFQQLDFRLDKKWVLDNEIWSVYLDIQNVLNTKNTESIRYSYNYKLREDITGLPFLPALGLKGEF